MSGVLHPLRVWLGWLTSDFLAGMDSLDRTNVVQSALAKYILDKQLVTAGLLNPGDSVNNHSEFMTVFRNSASNWIPSVKFDLILILSPQSGRITPTPFRTPILGRAPSRRTSRAQASARFRARSWTAGTASSATSKTTTSMARDKMRSTS